MSLSSTIWRSTEHYVKVSTRLRWCNVNWIGVPFFYNERTGKAICGVATCEKLKQWSTWWSFVSTLILGISNVMVIYRSTKYRSRIIYPCARLEWFTARWIAATSSRISRSERDNFFSRSSAGNKYKEASSKKTTSISVLIISSNYIMTMSTATPPRTSMG